MDMRRIQTHNDVMGMWCRDALTYAGEQQKQNGYREDALLSDAMSLLSYSLQYPISRDAEKPAIGDGLLSGWRCS
jgi:hypothetical protein